MHALLASSTSSWIIDLGLPHIKSVSIANGYHCPVFGESVVYASSQITLNKVLYMPDFSVNLLSISAITCQLYYSVTFFPNHCTFQDLQTEIRIGFGREHGHGVYMLIQDNILSGLASVAATADSSLLWHYRLDHPSHHNLQQALSWITVESFICESCHLGKHHYTTYKRSKLSSSQGPFDLVHCNIWRPTRSVSASDFHYYIVFVNDYYRVSCIRG